MKTFLFSTIAIVTFTTTLLILNAAPAGRGTAYIYHQNKHGTSLANGEIFRHDRLTAGHASIPLGTVVRVTNLSNQRGIDVLVNDRTAGGTAIILTQTAASMIGMGDRGAQVLIEPLGDPFSSGRQLQSVPATEKLTSYSATSPAAPSGPPSLYFLEFASYKNVVQATLLAKKLTKRGAPSKVVQDQKAMYHVISDGYFTNLQDASRAFHLVNGNVGYTPVIKKI